MAVPPTTGLLQVCDHLAREHIEIRHVYESCSLIYEQKKKWHRSSWDCMIVDFYSDKLLSCWKWYIHDCRVLQERKNCVLHTVTSCSLVEQTSWSSCVFSMKRSIRLFMTWCWTHQRLQKGTVKLFACLVKCAEKPLIDLYWSKGYSIIKYTNDIVTEMKTKNVGMDSSSFTFIF